MLLLLPGRVCLLLDLPFALQNLRGAFRTRVHSRRQVNDELRKHSNGDAGLMRKHARARVNGGNPVGVLS